MSFLIVDNCPFVVLQFDLLRYTPNVYHYYYSTTELFNDTFCLKLIHITKSLVYMHIYIYIYIYTSPLFLMYGDAEVYRVYFSVKINRKITICVNWKPWFNLRTCGTKSVEVSRMVSRIYVRVCKHEKEYLHLKQRRCMKIR